MIGIKFLSVRNIQLCVFPYAFGLINHNILIKTEIMYELLEFIP